MRRFLITLAAALFVGFAADPLRADPYAQIIVFGDSLSDVGNTFAAAGKPPPPYYQGHYSNGPIWVERLATLLGTPAPKPSLLGGSDYAFGGAETGAGAAPSGVPNVLTQVNAYLASHKPAKGQLFVVWAGANNFFDGQTNPLVPVSDIGTAVSLLAANGARDFVVPNYPNLASTPFGHALPPAAQQGLTLLTQGYDQALAAEMTQLQAKLGVRIFQFDNYGTFQNIIANPAAFGFTNVTTSALDDHVFSGNGYLFWDSVHPTTAGHQIIGDDAFAAMAPEPTSVVLLSTGALGLTIVGWRRRRMNGRSRVAVVVMAIVLSIPDTSWAQTVPPTEAVPVAELEAQPAPVRAAQTWSLIQAARADLTWLPGSGGHGLAITDEEVSVTFAVPIVKDLAPLMVTPYAAAHQWTGPSGVNSLAAPGLPTHLYDLNAEFAWRPRLAEWLFADLAVTPGLYTDFRDVHGDSFMLRGRGLAIVAFSPEFQVAGGGMYVNRNKTKFVPAGGIIWNPTADTRFFLVFPQPKISQRIATIGVTQLWLYLAGEFGGGRWEIQHLGVADSVDYTDLRVIAGVESVHAQRWKAHVEVGYAFARRVNYSSDTPDYKPQDTLMLRAGIRF